MARLYKLMHGKSKDGRKSTIMVDTLRKCINLRDAREPNVRGHHEIVPAEATDRRKRRRPVNGGYISGGTFNAHT